MSGPGWLQILIYVVVLTALTPLLGGYMARAYMGRRVALGRERGPVERAFYRVRFGGAPWNVTFNTTSSFSTNTNWQYYGGETTMSHFSQMAGLAVQNFVSAAVGMAVLAAVIRGFARRETSKLGNFWVDLTRTLLYILLPLSVIGTLLLVSQGVVQTFTG